MLVTMRRGVSNFIGHLKDAFTMLRFDREIVIKKSDDTLSQEELQATISQSALFIMILSSDYIISSNHYEEEPLNIF